ncbi:dual specificity protein phosphatase CDC14AB [Caerostris extrusa]|uniref:Dual specificity protein phosphatase CDC14AB n=1 Tax=Caerostris extrusa TaxID=172846 RepID=A0AAV4P2I2_CAEEX|nr:dual specificity protein phosphatase CDC14AB [Caerostris extrusa]
MDELENISLHVAEFIKGRLYFSTLQTPIKPRSTANTHFFSIDSELLYESFYSDFGPLNLAKLYRYCCKLNKKLKILLIIQEEDSSLHYFRSQEKSECCIFDWVICYNLLEKSPVEAYQPLVSNNSPLFIPFRDASFSHCTYNLTLSDCLHAVSKEV